MKKQLLDYLLSLNFPHDCVEANADQIVFKINVKAKTGSKKEGIAWKENVLVSTRARPIGGQANQAIEEMLADFFGVPLKCVLLAKGETSKIKTFLITIPLQRTKDENYYISHLRKKCD